MKLWNQSLSVARARASQTEAAARETRDRGLSPLGKMKTDFLKISEDFVFLTPTLFFSFSLSIFPTRTLCLSTALSLSQHPALSLSLSLPEFKTPPPRHALPRLVARKKREKEKRKKCKSFFFFTTVADDAKKTSTSFPPSFSSLLPSSVPQELIRSCTPIASFSCS